MSKKRGSSKKKKETILVFSAHSDDFVIGAGGTIANYTKEGKNVIAIVFSYGEKSHPWLKESVVQKMRANETFEASELLKCKAYFFDLKELNFQRDYKKKKVEKTLLKLIKTLKPTKIFTHSGEDPHPDHQAVNKFTLALYNKLTKKDKTEIYIYSVWNPVSFKTKYPSLYVNVTKSFSLKMQALKTFRSQKIHVAYPSLLLLYRSLKDGFKIKTWFGEHFFRIR